MQEVGMQKGRNERAGCLRGSGSGSWGKSMEKVGTHGEAPPSPCSNMAVSCAEMRDSTFMVVEVDL